jgi:coenzyme PQQ synthesis protein D (PqqD)
MATPGEPLETSSILDSAVSVPGHVVYRAFASETVILNLQTGKYHGVNQVGGRMLEVLHKATSAREAAVQLAEEYNRPLEEIERDLSAFCSDLAQRGLVELKHDGSG